MNTEANRGQESRTDPQQVQEPGEHVALASSALPGEVPSRVLIAPWGRVESANGAFVLDEEAGRAVLDAFARHGTDVPVDYEHQSLGGAYASPSGQAPAAGWIRALHVVEAGTADAEAGLYADVEWTEAAAARLTAREYRYLSPVVIVRKSDRRVMSLHSAALTNKPAITGMRPIVNRQEQDSARPAMEMLRLRLGLPGDAEQEAVLAAAEERIVALNAELARRDAQERVAAALRAGKLAGGQQEWAMRLALESPECFDAWAASAPALVAVGRTQPPEAGAGGRNRSAVAASARAAFRAQPSLAALTSEEAWVAEALREAGMGVISDCVLRVLH